MRAWRIYPHTAPYALVKGFNPLDGAGGRVAAGRWNDPGHPVIYAAATASLAALETIANLRHAGRFGERMILEINLADDIEHVSFEQVLRLREDAPVEDPEQLTREFGSAWLKEGRSLALVVPSLVMPYDTNVLINPLHTAADSLKILRSERIRLDGRIITGADAAHS